MSRLFVVTAAALLPCAGICADGVSLSLDEALREAADHAPELALSTAHAQTRRAEVSAAGQLPTTVLSGGIARDDPYVTAGLAQKLPSFSRGARIDAATADAEQARLEMIQTGAAVRASTRRAFFALVKSEQLVALGEQTLRITSTAESAARARFETGASPRLDVVQASLARASVQTEQTQRIAEQESASAELALLLGRDPTSPISAVTHAPPPEVPFERVLQLSAQGPLAQSKEAAVHAAKLRLDAARLDRLPTATLGVGVDLNQQSSPASALKGTIDLELPLLSFNHGEIAVASAQLMEASLERDTQARQRIVAIFSAHRKFRAALETAHRYETEILPAAAEAEQMALEAYRAGRAPLASLLEAERSAAETRAKAVQSRFDVEDAYAQLETAAGVALDR